MQTWLMNEVAFPLATRQEPDNTLNLLDVDFWLWYQKVTPKGMAHAFKIKFWDMFNIPGYYNIQSVYITKQQWWLYVVESPNCMSQMERRDRQGCKNPPMAKCTCWPHLWVCLRGNQTIHQTVSGKCHEWYDMEWGCKAYSCNTGHATSSTSGQGSGTEHCVIKQFIWAVYPAWLTGWSGSSVKTSR